jgi:hypothetical protein
MTDRTATPVIAEGTRAQASASITAPRTYPMGRRPGGDREAISARLASARTELAAGNITSAIKSAQFVSGHCARHGERRVASLVRHAVQATRNHQWGAARILLTEADSTLNESL